MADPTAALAPEPVIGSRLGCTKYLMPLLAPGVRRKSTSNSNWEKRSRVMMSPPPDDSAPELSITFSVPSLMNHPFCGNSSDLALRQPSPVLPSHSKRQPAFFSSSVRVFMDDSVLAVSADTCLI